MEHMQEYLKDVVKDLDVFIEKRGDGGYIAVANKFKHLTKGKNVFTYWQTAYSIAVIVLGLLPRKIYYSVEEMEKDKVAEKIRSKYNEMVG